MDKEQRKAEIVATNERLSDLTIACEAVQDAINALAAHNGNIAHMALLKTAKALMIDIVDANKEALQPVPDLRKRVIRRDDGAIFKSQQEAADALGISRAAVWQALNVGCKAGGYTYEYVTEAQHVD